MESTHDLRMINRVILTDLAILIYNHISHVQLN
jgi:hypothetical protein